MLNNRIFGVIVMLCIGALFTMAQKKMMMLQGDGIMILQEVGVVLSNTEGKITVIDLLPGEMRGKEAQKIDVQKDDIVLMANGKKMEKTDALKEHYEQTAVGKEIKLGMKRGDNLFIVSFTKEEQQKEGPGERRMVMKFDKKQGDEALPALGLMVTEKEKQVSVKITFPNIDMVFKEYVPQEGDVIVSLNGTAVRSTEQFIEQYDELGIGESATFVFSRDGKESTVTIKKPKPQQKIIIKK